MERAEEPTILFEMRGDAATQAVAAGRGDRQSNQRRRWGAVHEGETALFGNRKLPDGDPRIGRVEEKEPPQARHAAGRGRLGLFRHPDRENAMIELLRRGPIVVDGSGVTRVRAHEPGLLADRLQESPTQIRLVLAVSIAQLEHAFRAPRTISASPREPSLDADVRHALDVRADVAYVAERACRIGR